MKRKWSGRLAVVLLLCLLSARSVARVPETPMEMAAATERWLVGGAGARFPDGMTTSAREADSLVFVDETWPAAFQERAGETVLLHVSEQTGCYEFIDIDGIVFWTVVPATPLTWDWVSPFRSPFQTDTHDLYSPFRLAWEWRLVSSTENLNEPLRSQKQQSQFISRMLNEGPKES